VLTANTETPVVTETTVGADLLKTLKVLTHLLVDLVGKYVRVLAVGHVLLTVKEPSGDLELSGVLHDGDDTLELVRVELSGAGGSAVERVLIPVIRSTQRANLPRMVHSPLVEVNIGLLANNVGVTTTNTLDLGQGEHDLALSLNVGVKETENVLFWSAMWPMQEQITYLELLVSLGDGERHDGRS
jgi:hypothetical protein